jgi:uncharacterized membrane protein
MIELTLWLATLIALAAVSSALPFLTRPELFFAVMVDGGFRRTETARNIIRQYRLIGWGGTVFVALLSLRFLSPHAALLVTSAVWALAFFIVRSRVWPHRSNPTSIREASLSRHERFPGGVAVLLGPFVILAAKAVYVHRRWDLIPERFPERFPAYGSLGGVALICALMLAISYGTLRASRRVAATGPQEQSERRFRNVSVLGLVVLTYLMAIVLPPISGALPEIPFTPFLIVGVSLLFVGVLAWFGQGGTRLRGYEPALTGSAPTGDRTPDECWKLGMFYYNPDDPALVVEKRFGIGWTLNFGNHWCWVILGAIVATPFLMRLLR